eukprot:COSAG06_NODE_14329_length_1166_cov_1.408622_1_plen_173_part_10
MSQPTELVCTNVAVRLEPSSRSTSTALTWRRRSRICEPSESECAAAAHSLLFDDGPARPLAPWWAPPEAAVPCAQAMPFSLLKCRAAITSRSTTCCTHPPHTYWKLSVDILPRPPGLAGHSAAVIWKSFASQRRPAAKKLIIERKTSQDRIRSVPDAAGRSPAQPTGSCQRDQ